MPSSLPLMTWHMIAAADDLSLGQRKLCEIAGRRIALFRREQGWIAIDNHCPHRGGPVGAGPTETRSVSEGSTLTRGASEDDSGDDVAQDAARGGRESFAEGVVLDGESSPAKRLPTPDILICPWHSLRFDLATGRCHDSPTVCLTHLPVQVIDGQVQVSLEPAQPKAETDIYRCLVRYGRPGHVGRFGSIEKIDCQRGEMVLVRTDRGVEIGEVLVGVDEFDKRDERPPAGELLRKVVRSEQGDERCFRGAKGDIPERIVKDVILLDHELTYDGQTLILYHAAEGRAELGPLAAKLAAELGVPRVQFETLVADQSRTVAAAHPKKENDDMRGPYERTKYDFRRVWECPVCHHRERTAGSVTSLFCNCQAKEERAKQLPMKLVDDGPRRVDGKTLPPRKPGLAESANQ